jgi:hypothetical protein
MKMNKRRSRVALLGCLLLTATAFAGDKEQLSVVNFRILKEFNGKPLKNASVVLHPVDKNGKQKRTGAQLKTDSEGKTSYPGVPFGKVRVQVIATGFQTFGEDYDINQDHMDIEIKLKRPQEQFSIYEKKQKAQAPEEKKEEKN